MSSEILIVIFSCYFIGSIPFGLIIGKINKIDIRNEGSGNIGATNVLRILGKKWGVFCFSLDACKGLLPVTFFKYQSVQRHWTHSSWIPVIAIICVVCGHVFSLFLKFKGGKGIATSAGAILAVAPMTLLITFSFWFFVFKKSGYVSLASILAAIFLPFLSFFLNLTNKPLLMVSQPVLYLFVLLALLSIFMHRTNIKRLRNGTESSFKKKDNNESSSS